MKGWAYIADNGRRMSPFDQSQTIPLLALVIYRRNLGDAHTQGCDPFGAGTAANVTPSQPYFEEHYARLPSVSGLGAAH